MKLYSFSSRQDGEIGAPRVGLEREDRSILDLTNWVARTPQNVAQAPLNMLSLIEDASRLNEWAEGFIAHVRDLGDAEARQQGLLKSPDELRLSAPLPRPKKIIAVLVNSQGMLGGTDIQLTHPRLFMKASSAVIGPEEIIHAPSYGVRPEVELGIVIGKRLSHAGQGEAEEAVFGYTIFNDVTAPRDSKEDAYPAYRRDASAKLRKMTLRGPLFRSKNHDTFAPMGPCIVTRDELADVGDLRMVTRFNSEVIQEGSTSQYLFTPREILSFISSFLTLEPGDFVAAGTIGWTSAGGNRADPSERILPLTDGILELEIEGIGVLRNPVRFDSASQSHNEV